MKSTSNTKSTIDTTAEEEEVAVVEVSPTQVQHSGETIAVQVIE